jgi:HEPN domain-containing protein
MPPEERYEPDDPREWLGRARSSLIKARGRQAGVYLEDLCFDAQQAAETAITAVLIRRGAAFPSVHDLALVLALLERAGEPAPVEVQEAARLTRFAVAGRYPGVGEPVTEAEYERAVGIAEAVVAWAEQALDRSSR